MQALLSFDKAPPFAAPLRFFLTAPLFGVLAGLLLAVDGENLLFSRWTPGALSATHLVTVGFMLQIMLGSLIQILPVVAGANLGHPLAVARVLHGLLSLGTLALACGFYLGHPVLLSAAAVLLGGAGLLFLGSAGYALFRVPSTSPTIRALKLSMLGLAGVLSLGILLLMVLTRGWPLSLPAFADLHAAWGLGGWSAILLAAVAYIVVPMFQLTPGYPARTSWRFPVFVLGCLLAWSLAVLMTWHGLLMFSQLLLALSAAAFALLTLRLQGLRRRARADATYRYWQFGLCGVFLAMAMLSTAALRPGIADAPGWAPVFGMLLVAGGFVPFIIGMLYKIVPFLAWLHLQELGQMRVPAPPMNRLLPDVQADRQMRCYGLATLLLLLAPFLPDLGGRLAGLAYAGALAWLWLNLLGAVRRYRQHVALVAAKLGAV